MARVTRWQSDWPDLAELISREVDEGPPLAVSYQLTEAGLALAPALAALTTWAAENLPE